MNNRNSRGAISFLCCLLAVPTCTKLLPGFQADSIQIALIAGALLGLAHLCIRPMIRILAAPIGCLTLGLIQPLIDMGLIYACDKLVNGFAVTVPFHALLAVILINTITFIASGRH